jgi:hypothetical protein
MSLVKGKFVDKTIPIQSDNDPVDVKDLARKGYVDSQAASAADAKVEDQIVDGVTTKAPSQNAVFDALALKQASLGTGTTDQFLRGDLSWQEVATSVGIAQTKVVSKGGDDVTGDGTLTKPFATIAAAMASISDATPTKRYMVQVKAGAYTEGALALKANVFIVGDLKEAVRITASSVAMAADFTGSADNRSGIARVILTGACNFDWSTVTSAAGKLYFTEVSFNSAITMYGHNNASAQSMFDSCQFYSSLTISGINVGVFTNNYCFGNITLNQHPGGGMPTILATAGGQCQGTVTLNATVSDFNRRCSLFAKNFMMNAITVHGASAYADVTDSSLPSAGPTITNGGNVVYLNPIMANRALSNLSYPTAVNQPILPATTSATNLGDWGKQWMFIMGYVHASSGTDLYLTSVMQNYDPAGDSAGRAIYIQADGYGLQTNVNGGNIELETAAVSGTGVRGKVQIKARELDMTSAKISNLADGADPQDAVSKSQLDSAISGVTIDVIDDAITDGVTDRAPSQNAVYDALALKLSTSLKGASNGLAELDETGKVPSSQLPGFVDDVEEYSNLLSFPEEGSAGKLYVAQDTNKVYRWSGTVYIEIAASPGSTDSVAEGTTNLYFTAARAKTAAVVNSTAGSETDQAASVDAMKSYVAGEISAIPAAQTLQGKKERKVLSATDITNGYIDCAFEAMAETMMVMTGGVVHNEGAGDDYVLSVVAGKTRITFEPDLAAILAADDDIYLQYLRLA